MNKQEPPKEYMNIGIDFNTKTTKAATLVSGVNLEDCKIFETKNILVFANGTIFAGDDGFNKFLTEKDATIYDLDQIIEWNALIVNKTQISVEKCLSVIFLNLLNKIKKQTQISEIGFVCISIPYDKYYYWHGLIKKAFSLIGIEKVRIISQPAAFFAQLNINYLLDSLNQENLRMEQQRKYLYNQEVKKYEKLPWYKKFLSKKPKYQGGSEDTGYIFASISQNNTNVSLVNFNYREGVLEVLSTQYTNNVTRRKIEHCILDYFVSEIKKDKRNFAVKDKKTLLRILEKVNELLRTPQVRNTFEIDLPYILCEDGEYRILDTKIDLIALRNFLTPTFNNLVETIKLLAEKTQETQKYCKYQAKIKNIIVVSDQFIQSNIKEALSKVFDASKIVFGTEKSLAIGAFNFSRIMTGENRDFLALEVIPFSVFMRLGGGEFIELIKKDTVLPTISNEYFFIIEGKRKSKFIEVHLTTKEGTLFQSLSVWKIKIDNWKAFGVQVNIDQTLKITLKAYGYDDLKSFSEIESTLRTLQGQKPENELIIQEGNTFSFSGAGFEVGIKGKDIRQYILNQFNYLNAVLKNNEVAIFEPDETFYSMLKEGNLFKALRYLGAFLKLKSLPDIEMVDSKFFEEQGIDGFISGSKIIIPKYFTKDPYGFGYVLAHELAHYILIHEEQIILDDEQENEILTEIFVIYSGMGKLFLNGFKSKSVGSLSFRTHGYFNEKIIKYIHEIYISRFNIKISDYRKNLTDEARKILDELMK